MAGTIRLVCSSSFLINILPTCVSFADLMRHKNGKCCQLLPGDHTIDNYQKTKPGFLSVGVVSCANYHHQLIMHKT